ncbi:unnamed protein product, partial [Effrenium voratum]
VVLRESSGELLEEVQRIAKARSLLLSDAWELQALKREDVRRALELLVGEVSKGQRIRLLCHCRPHVRCHVELIKQHLDRFLPQQIAPGSTFKEELVDIEGRVWPGSVPDAVPRPTFHFRGLSCGIPATTEEQCSIRTAAFSCTRDSRALDPGTMKGYCAQCWCHHSKVCRWPDFHDEWPTETYQDEYAPTSNGDSGNARPMCSFYWRGCCKFGDTCWYSHPKKVCRSRVGRRAALARGSHRGFGYQRPCTGGESAQRWLSRPFWFGQRRAGAKR